MMSLKNQIDMHEQDGKGNIVDSGFNSGAGDHVSHARGAMGWRTRLPVSCRSIAAPAASPAAAIDVDGSISMARGRAVPALVQHLTSAGSLDTTFDADGKRYGRLAGLAIPCNRRRIDP